MFLGSLLGKPGPGIIIGASGRIEYNPTARGPPHSSPLGPTWTPPPEEFFAQAAKSFPKHAHPIRTTPKGGTNPMGRLENRFGPFKLSGDLTPQIALFFPGAQAHRLLGAPAGRKRDPCYQAISLGKRPTGAPRGGRFMG